VDWVEIVIGIVTALLFAIGLPLALKSRKKGGGQKVEQLFQHLVAMGVKASLVERGAAEEEVGLDSAFGQSNKAFVQLNKVFGQRSEGAIRIEEKNIDYINVVSVASQYGVNYLLEFLVRTSGWASRKRKRTRILKKKGRGLRGRVVDIGWKGDDYLSHELTHDYRLKDLLLQVSPEELKGSFWIFPETKHEYARVRISYLLPSSGLFEAVDLIAKHVKSVW
jgi:hypothetical protein